MSEAKFILSKKKVLEQYDKVENICDVVSYSSKTNPIVNNILEENTNCMFSVHIKNELENIKDKSRVIFLAQGWDENSIWGYFEEGIKSFIIDNEKDLEILVEFMEKSGGYETFGKINLFLRIKLKENTIKTERYFVFGMNSEVINKKIRELRDKKYISELGIHFHRKTQNMSEWNLKYEFENMIDVLDLIDVVNIGGGLPSYYANTNVDVINVIIEKIKEFRDFLKDKKLMIEPGRFIAAPSCKLVTEIIIIYDNNIIVNASVYNSDMDALIVPVKLLVENELKKGKNYVIKGITPCSMDLFRYKVCLDNPKVGNKLVFLNAGAYNFTTDFCGLDKIETEIVD